MVPPIYSLIPSEIERKILYLNVLLVVGRWVSQKVFVTNDLGRLSFLISKGLKAKLTLNDVI